MFAIISDLQKSCRNCIEFLYTLHLVLVFPDVIISHYCITFFFYSVINFRHITVYMSVPIAQFSTPPSPPHRSFPPLVSIRLFSTSVSQLLPWKPVHLYHCITFLNRRNFNIGTLLLNKLWTFLNFIIFSINVLFLFQYPFQDSTLHTVMSSGLWQFLSLSLFFMILMVWSSTYFVEYSLIWVYLIYFFMNRPGLWVFGKNTTEEKCSHHTRDTWHPQDITSMLNVIPWLK